LAALFPLCLLYFRKKAYFFSSFCLESAKTKQPQHPVMPGRFMGGEKGKKEKRKKDDITIKGWGVTL